MAEPALAPLDKADRRWLLAVAAPSEAGAIAARLGSSARGAGPAPEDAYWKAVDLNGRMSLVLTGVGKANAAGAVARVFDPSRHLGVISIGIAGALPGGGLALLDSVLASASVFADEGSENPEGYADIASLGFAPTAGIPGGRPGMAIAASAALSTLLEARCARTGVIATVSTCAGSDARAAEVVRRTGAIAEAMEGGAAGLALARVTAGAGLFAELRIISNTTGERGQQAWRLRDALDRLGSLAASL